jgi:hypothetical protein
MKRFVKTKSEIEEARLFTRVKEKGSKKEPIIIFLLLSVFLIKRENNLV